MGNTGGKRKRREGREDGGVTRDGLKVVHAF